MTKTNTFILTTLLAIVGLGACQSAHPTWDPVDYVDPQLGATHCRWFFYTPAALPFGMAKLAPTTNAYGSYGSWLPCGYDDRHTSIEGFAHLHEFQIGGVVTLPTTGPLLTLPGTLDDPYSGYRSPFSKETEHATAGSYEVVLERYGVKAELTATQRVGFHRYTYPKSEQSRILFDIGHPQGESAQVIDTRVTYNPATHSVSGFVTCYPIYATFCDVDNYVTAYFYAQLHKTPTAVGAFRNAEVFPSQEEITGKGTGLYIEFPTEANEVVEMQVGLSFTSVEDARLNLEAEATGVTFDQVAAQARAAWNQALSCIRVEGESEANKTKFYTGLYHALLGRGISSNADGTYITHNKEIAKANHYQHNTDGMWGGFWNLTQLWTLAYPSWYESYTRSVLDFASHSGGWMHDGQAAGVYTNGVQTNFQGLVAVAAYHAGILKDVDPQQLWEIVYRNEMGYQNRPDGSGRMDNQYFVERGYVPSLDIVLSNGWVCNFGASHTLEYSFAAYAAAQLAQQLGKTEEAEKLRAYANGYRLLFDKETGYIRLREPSGEFIKDFDPMKAWTGYQEGNAAQYTWYAPHDIAGLMQLIGKDRFNERLEETFRVSSQTLYGGKPGEFDSFSGVEMLYNHGNQPCLFNPWLFNYSGKPWLTQLYTRDICDVFYGTQPTHGYGYGQDEDQGQLGAWYVLAAMGLFDVQGGTRAVPTMQLGSPQFDKITIALDRNYYKGRKFEIEVINNAPKNYYIQSATLNGKPLNDCFIALDVITRGGKLVLTMGPEPNTSWGVATPPPSMSTDYR